MQLMKQTTIALVLCAIPATAFGQSDFCEACTHDVSVYMGDGGLVAEAEGGVVAWVATCGNVIRHGELAPNPDGVVTMQFMDSGLVCNADESRLQVGPVKDGGWYWITDDTASAGGSLVSQRVLDNAKTSITSAGPGVTMREGMGAVFLKETATGRVGLLPNILPEPPTVPLRKCGYDRSGTDYTRRVSHCTLGDGGAMILATVTDGITGVTVQIPNAGAVTRPAGTGTLKIVVDLWMNGSGHYTTSLDSDANAKLGHPEFAMTETRAADRLTDIDYALALGSGQTATVIVTGDDPTAGVSVVAEDSAATISIVKDEEFCSSTNNVNVPLPVTIRANFDANRTQVTPNIFHVGEGGPATGNPDDPGSGSEGPSNPDDPGGATPDKGGGPSFTIICP